MYLQHLDLARNARILHIAPEKGLADRISRLVDSGNYFPADIDTKRYGFLDGIRFIDLCNLSAWPSEDFDLIVHSHVLEHTVCNLAYTLHHLHRMLTPKGKHVFVVPFLSGCWDETFQDIGDEERTRRFGQFDHVRLFGRDDINSHLGKILELPDHFDATETFTARTLMEANIPERAWQGFTPDTIITLDRKDIKLFNR